MEGYITDALELALKKRGLTKSDSNLPDLLIGYQAALLVPAESAGSSPETKPAGYVASLALEMYDANTKKLVWRGRVWKPADPKAKLATQQANIVKSAEKLAEQYPGPTKKESTPN